MRRIRVPELMSLQTVLGSPLNDDRRVMFSRRKAGVNDLNAGIDDSYGVILWNRLGYRR